MSKAVSQISGDSGQSFGPIAQRGLGFLIINGIEVNDVRMTTTVTLIVVVFAVAANSLMLALDRRAHHLA
jgi:ABC-type proline/glycine betaine transport system permease subunit